MATKRSKLSMQLSYESDSSQASSEAENADDSLDPNSYLESSEFNPQHQRKRRRTGKSSKESAALGVFGSDSEDEDGRYWKNGKKSGSGKGLRYGGVAFTKAKAVDEEEEEEETGKLEEDDVQDEVPEDFSVEATAGLRGLGAERDEMDEEEYEAPRRGGLGMNGGLGYSNDGMDVDEEDGPRAGLGGGLGASSRAGFMFAPRGLGSRTADTSGASTPHTGLGFQSAGSSTEGTPEPTSLRKPMIFAPRTTPGKGGLGLGFRAGGNVESEFTQGATMDRTELDNTHIPQAPKINVATPLGKGFVSSAQRYEAAIASMPSAQPEKEEIIARPSFTQIDKPRGKRGKQNGEPDVGAQINTNSFAAKMMAKMGYVAGQGLGVKGEGILAPIEVKLRPQGVGVGAVKEKTDQARREEKRAKELRGEVVSDSDSGKERKARRRKKAAGGLSREDTPMSGASTPRRKPKYKTAKEMEKEAEGLHIPAALVNIIDFTGKEARTVTTGTPGLMGVLDTSKDDEANKIAQMARRDLENFTKEWKQVQNKRTNIDREERRLNVDVDAQAEACQRLTRIVDLVKGFEGMALTNVIADLSLAGWEKKIGLLTTELEKLQFEYKNEMEIYGLSEMAVSVFHPLFKSALSEWDPTKEPVYLLEYLHRLRHLFRVRTKEDIEAALAVNGVAEKSGKASTYYESMMYNIWLPKVRSAINNSWNVHDPTSVLALIESWSSVLPPYIHANILDQLILPKLKIAVSEWNPRTAGRKKSGSPPPHTWVFPWLPYLGERMDELLREVRRKFRLVLDKWDLSKGLIEGLDAWREAFGPGELEKILISHLLPRLAEHLRNNFEVNPANQTLDPLDAVLAWHEFFRLSTFGQLLESEFFPKWINTLYTWLTMPDTNYEEVSQWYEWWVSIFPESVRNSPAVRKQFAKGLQMMNDALDVAPGESVASTVAPPSAGPARPIRPSPPPPTKATRKPNNLLPIKENVPDGGKEQMETTFREYVEDWCAEHNLLLIPLRKAHDGTGQPLFRITESASGSGGVMCYFFQDVLWAQDRKKKEVFEPLGLEGVETRVEAGHHQHR